MGCRQLSVVLDTFSIEMWWRLRSKDSLWCRYFKTRYFPHDHPTDVSANNTASHVWRRLLRGRDLVEHHIGLDVGEGSTLAGKVQWLAGGRLCAWVPDGERIRIPVVEWAIGSMHDLYCVQEEGGTGC